MLCPFIRRRCVHGWTSDWLGGDWETLRVGWEHYQTTDPHEIFIDDVAMDTARIGCR